MATMSFNPQTPQSPSQLSPSTGDQVSSMNSSMTSITTALPTPAHSVNGSAQPGDMAHDIAMADAYSTKRKYPFDDGSDHEHKKVHLEDRRVGIENLHLDVGEKYLLCSTRKAPFRLIQAITPSHPSSPRLMVTAKCDSYPCLSNDLFEMFGLTGIAAEVARTKPNGEKNALRKTYKGQIKTLGLSGHFDAVKKEPEALDGLMALTHIPEDVWYSREVSGKEIEKGFSQLSPPILSRAATMAKGAIPKSVWDSSVLGDLAPGAMTKKVGHDQATRPTAPSTPAASAPGVTPKAGKPLTPQLDRARRIGKKRSYQDSSFEGYGEGYADDDAGGYSTGDGDDRSKLKRRKQVHADHP
ncbi:Rox3-domain-containing protein [Hypoxylon trugodes]|uniref:Rox3-domain-containing protein n=1 Tax=Hypoxylon trugodes TaxID=326681 RepID=UPI0021937681|nr:Rox3-domain-containing protein [Hypoxylon trugodes]KAI1391067.1 Rox3-domain-containing protein [Hypoxylon trugodes]